MSKVLIDLYERALKASWPEGAKGEAFDLWNEARILQQEPAADCGLEVFTVPGRYLAVNKKNPGAQDVVLKSDADASDAMRLERIAELEANIQRLTSNPADHRYWEGRWRDAYAELAALKAQVKGLVDALEMCVRSMRSVLPDFNPHDQAAFDMAGKALTAYRAAQEGK